MLLLLLPRPHPRQLQLHLLPRLLRSRKQHLPPPPPPPPPPGLTPDAGRGEQRAIVLMHSNNYCHKCSTYTRYPQRTCRPSDLTPTALRNAPRPRSTASSTATSRGSRRPRSLPVELNGTIAEHGSQKACTGGEAPAAAPLGVASTQGAQRRLSRSSLPAEATKRGESCWSGFR